MKPISRTKMLFGLGAAVAGLALAGPVAASAATAPPTVQSVQSVGRNTDGCAYRVTTSHIHLYKTPGGTPNHTVLARNQAVVSSPRTVVAGPHGTQWVFVTALQTNVPLPVGFVNKAFLMAESCKTPANS
jgi:hypothetical protein